MTLVNVCIKYKDIRHIGGLHMNAVDFGSDELCALAKPIIKGIERDSREYYTKKLHARGIVRSTDIIVAERVKLGLFPLCEENLPKMARYLIKGLERGYPFYKPQIMIDFDKKELLVNERRTSHLRNYEDCAGPFKYLVVNQRTLDDAILAPTKDKE